MGSDPFPIDELFLFAFGRDGDFVAANSITYNVNRMDSVYLHPCPPTALTVHTMNENTDIFAGICLEVVFRIRIFSQLYALIFFINT